MWNPGKMDVVKAIMDMTDGYGCDVYIEATGHPSAVTQGMQMIRKLGTFVEFSVFAQPTTLDWSIIGDKKELNVFGAHISPYTYPFVLEGMVKGTIKTDGVVTKVFSLDEWKTAFHYPDASHVGMVVGRDSGGKLLICHCSSGANKVVISEYATSGFVVLGRPAIYAP